MKRLFFMVPFLVFSGCVTPKQEACVEHPRRYFDLGDRECYETNDGLYCTEPLSLDPEAREM